ncbi:phage shock protein PspA [Gynuella sunshinyii]|uniref:Phage shock protein A (IM30), suppresses sigma54-dependent transcription n=1 Tax=Gynuella sunshinyii YC6258 TaxID=1445510 RepID=A0A0C5UZ46_9GAMM|nr:phage shock protein PspA [Gynuella sunshinyii]AJQ92605.1 phage shock protein A (IM30), suppresses sigma54-dependent transcription [Gynuella sunshinyii YC6258]
MGIFSRMTDIINSNISALLDKAEDPQKMIRMIIQEMEETLVEVRSSSARVIADRKTAGRRLERLSEEAHEWESKAEMAINKGREDLARAALAEKREVEQEVNLVESELKELDGHLNHLSEEISQLQTKLNDAKAKQKAVMMRKASVEHRMKVKRQTHRAALDDAFAKFEHFERRMDNLEGQVEAMDLGMDVKSDLKSEIDALANDDAVNDELERLKAKLKTKVSEKDQ